MTATEELVKFMESLGFEYLPSEYYTYFTMNEGTCEVTVDGAKTMFAALSQQHEREKAEADEHYLMNLLDHDTHPWRGPCPDDCVERVAGRDLKRLQQQSNGGTHE